jgi:putative tryptophan/tyrosine transport system substrate-binding protein
MKRREFIGLIGGAAAWPLAAAAQQSKKIPRIGILWHAGSKEEEAPFLGWLRQGFTDLGYVEGKNIIFEDRYPDEKPERFVALANELVSINVDVLIAISIPAALAAQKATAIIPIVMAPPPDPVALGLISSLAHPGGNITGLSSMSHDLVAKRLQLFKEMIPGLSRVAALLNPNLPLDADRFIAENRTAAEILQISIDPVMARVADDLERIMSDVAERRYDGLIVSQNPSFFAERKHIVDLALAKRIPTLCPADVFVEAGGLMSYSTSWKSLFNAIAPYVKRILEGEKPAEMPVQQPVKFYLVINLKTATAFGLEIPATMLARADRVIE